MSKKKRVPPTSIFIACEGKNTEPIYFEKIKEIVEEDFNLAITIYPDKNDEAHSSHALGLVEEARSRIDEFDEVWAVFDKNGYTKHREAFDLANQQVLGKKVNIAFSSISFEHWVLLHFEKSNTAFPKSKDIIDRLAGCGYFPEYEKKTYIDTFSRLQERTAIALENSAWLEYQKTSSGLLPDTPVYQLNPYTNVGKLVKRLLGIETVFIWSGIGIETTVEDLQITLQYQGLVLSILIENKSNGQYVFNQTNIGQYLQIRDSVGGVNDFSLAATKLIAPGAKESLELSVKSPLAGNIVTFLLKGTKAVIELN
ncbi:RloB family protein [Chitinophaga ginsengisoli]|uniref:RloB-like protein n=1 Tax=Chitinophaga ginsengisoli TaxID=363837 RepID=A0A2P8GDC5_9BACT|nr:RloB family protein [Chitinophaga ginsengisoli]PSL31974.1 RloB-like protein [Chitinophaga ginsengisoli]